VGTPLLAASAATARGATVAAGGSLEHARGSLEDAIDLYSGALEGVVERAGLTPQDAGYLEAAFEYPDEATLLRAMLSSGSAVLAVRTSGHDAVRGAISAALAP
jgi:hypothetical protein